MDSCSGPHKINPLVLIILVPAQKPAEWISSLGQHSRLPWVLAAPFQSIVCSSQTELLAPYSQQSSACRSFAHALPGTWSEPFNNPPAPFSFFKCEDSILPLRSHQMSFHLESPPRPIQLDILLPSQHLHGTRTSARSDLSFSSPWIRGTYCVGAPSP